MRTITVKCPSCREVIEIDAQTGRIERHHPEVKTKPGKDFLSERLRSLEEEKSRREAVVSASREKERTKGAAHEELFAKVKKKAGEGPVERPLRDIDID